MSETKNTFYWYDYETFGLDARKEKPSQFAGIRTDLDLNPISKPDVFYCKVTEDYLPNPSSVMITGILPQDCEEKGLLEKDFASEVYSRLNADGTISLGYNTIRFDEEVNRFLFWRNFKDPYKHTWANNCSRWDIYPLVLAVWALRGNGINWPLNSEFPLHSGEDNNRNPDHVCFKLEALTKKNNIQHTHAHDALSDVYATLGLAKLIKEKVPKLWNWALLNRTKKKVLEALSKPRFLLVSQFLGQDKGFLMVGATIFQKENEALVWDLRYDPKELLSLSIEELEERMKYSSELPEGVSRLPIYRVKANACPFVCADIRVLTNEKAEKYGIDLSLTESRAQELLGFKDKLAGAFLSLMESKESEKSDVDASLYEGFVNPEDRRLSEKVATLSAEEFSSLVSAGKLNFEDERLNELLFRYQGRNFPQTFTKESLVRWQEFCYKRIMQGDCGGRSLAEFVDEIDHIAQTGNYDDEESLRRLDELYMWADRYYEKFADF